MAARRGALIEVRLLNQMVGKLYSGAMRFLTGVILSLLLSGLSPGWGGEVNPETILPPPHPWVGASRALLAPTDHPWRTPAEISDLRTTPSYDDTVAWLRRLVVASPKLSLFSIGRSHEGREIWMVLASEEGRKTKDREKPLVLAQAGIHGGEIDGKDAGLMLLRDLAFGEAGSILQKVDFLFVPILNVDGHERSSPYGRMNQRGPENMGWRTNARNLNLNRDFAKVETPEVRAILGVINEWDPDLYLDLHVTDGSDYAYDITFGWAGTQGHSPSTARWLDENFRPRMEGALEKWSHLGGPLIFLMDKTDPTQGRYGWMAGPRFSDGYGSARHLPTILVENHSLKPYDRRVLGTYVLLKSTLRLVGERFQGLRVAREEDRRRRLDPITLDWRVPKSEPPKVPFQGYETILEPSTISGGSKLSWGSEPKDYEIPLFDNRETAASVDRPLAYWVPATWPEVIEALGQHGLQMEILESPRTVEVELDRLSQTEMGQEAFEGRHRIAKLVTKAEGHSHTYPAGSVRIPLDQPLGNLAALLLEPHSPDSFLRWGYFNEILQRTEYAEFYALEAMAEEMMANDPSMRREFETKLKTDEAFRSDSRARLYFFYERSPWYDQRFNLYPVGREVP